ncbi:tail fiber assembly protein [Cupriavidus basilensis OR16]|uniref:Tail fiber assembly protein n=1 Tax=Cupriavidus basilensis OR16 TaxID=1127483 RepID=H1SDI5_9BURK|nr:DUF4376 domain-containing protein [Cupriavidus basilensis]EHP39439.1 tail fiber assembly protein [Cupriavidus basilensis OR16]
MDKIIYHFDPTTGELLASGPVYIGPAGDEQIAAFATLTPPPDPTEGYVAVVVPGSLTAGYGCSWSLVRDWRLTVLYRATDGAPLQAGASELAGWSGLGEIPVNITAQPRPSSSHTWSGGAWVFDLVAAKAAKLVAINAEWAQRQASPFAFGGHKFDADPVSTARILAAGQIGGIAKGAGRTYTASLPASDGSDVDFEADELVNLAMALAEHRDNCYRIAGDLKALLSTAASEEELAAIVWPSAGV